MSKAPQRKMKERLRHKRSYLYVIAVAVAIYVILDVYISDDFQLVNPVNASRLFSVYRPQTHLKTIMMYNKFFGMPAYGMRMAQRGFYKYNCSYLNCNITVEREDFEKADVVVFHGFLLGGSAIPRRARPDQLYAFFLMESPLIANQYDWLDGLDDLFNLTMTYYNHTDTDIVLPSGQLLPEPGHIPTVEEVKAKTKLVFWVVSNCHPLSTRQQYVTELSKYIPVDIYGKCGNMTCAKGDWTCFKNFSRDYMFNLAFENSYCVDYISDKVYRALQEPVVPITLGGGDYARVLPAKSYVDVRDFPSPRALARYLMQLSRDPAKYREYFQWKATYRAVDSQYTRGLGFCELCGLLNDPNYTYKSVFKPKVYWSPEGTCLKGEEERRSVHLLT